MWNATQQITTNAIETQKNSSVLARTSRITAFVMIRFTDTISPAAPACTTAKICNHLDTVAAAQGRSQDFILGWAQKSGIEQFFKVDFIIRIRNQSD